MMPLQVAQQRGTNQIAAINASGQDKLQYAAALELNQRQLESLRGSNKLAQIQLTGDQNYDRAAMIQASREDINDASNASRESIAGQGNEVKTNIANAQLQQKQGQATAMDLLAHAKMLAAIGDTEGAKQFSQIAGQMLQKQIGAPAPQAPPPGAPPAGTKPPRCRTARPWSQGWPDGRRRQVHRQGWLLVSRTRS